MGKLLIFSIFLFIVSSSKFLIIKKKTMKLFFFFVEIAFALECYVCNEQEENNDKCSKTVKQCNETEDTCASYIFWTCKLRFDH